MLVVDDDCVQRATTSKNQSELGGRTITVTATIREELYNRVGVGVACVATVGDARACNVVRVRGLGPKVTLEAVSAMFPPPLQVEENGKKFGSQRGSLRREIGDECQEFFFKDGDSSGTATRASLLQ